MSKRKAKSRVAVKNESKASATGGRSSYLFAIAALLALVGLADSIYLTVEKLTGGIVQCNGISNCEQVLSSPYATIAGIPLAAFGALAYFTVFSLAILATFRYDKASAVLLYVVGLMLGASVWLFILQA